MIVILSSASGYIFSRVGYLFFNTMLDSTSMRVYWEIARWRFSLTLMLISSLHFRSLPMRTMMHANLISANDACRMM